MRHPPEEEKVMMLTNSSFCWKIPCTTLLIDTREYPPGCQAGMATHELLRQISLSVDSRVLKASSLNITMVDTPKVTFAPISHDSKVIFQFIILFTRGMETKLVILSYTKRIHKVFLQQMDQNICLTQLQCHPGTLAKLWPIKPSHFWTTGARDIDSADMKPLTQSFGVRFTVLAIIIYFTYKSVSI